ncbi:Kinesin-related protein 1 [Diplonema papillatum]|nr:Kinesin-related protein 1 [Diplonema papillatum]
MADHDTHGKPEKAGVRVMVRVRPFNKRELGDTPNEYPLSIVCMEKEKVNVADAGGALTDSFEFHETFWSIPESQKQYCSKPFSDQEAVFQRTGVGAVDSALKGYHTCLFAYGQTGSGKTYTMLGSPEDPGVAPRLVDYLFEELEKVRAKQELWDWTVDISFMEIYNEKVKDLLAGESMGGRKKSRRNTGTSGMLEAPMRERSGSGSGLTAKANSFRRKGSHSRLPGTGKKKKSLSGMSDEADDYAALKVRQSPAVGIFVEGLTRLSSADGVSTAEDVIAVMRTGMEHRSTAATAMNDTSSRSHAVFQICLSAKNASQGTTRYSHINIVDLAGSERQKMSKSEGQTLTEATKINLSLSTLRRVIDSLIEQTSTKKKVFVPYRESLLTWLLSESLGGNSKTLMIATVSPAESNREDTINTLRYADKAKAIVNTVKVNEQKSSVMLSAMAKEMEMLRKKLNDPEQVRSEEEMEEMRDQQAYLEAEYMNQNIGIKQAEEKLKQQEKQLHEKQIEAEKKNVELQKLKSENIDGKYAAAQEQQARASEMMSTKKEHLQKVAANAAERQAKLEAERQLKVAKEEQLASRASLMMVSSHETIYARKEFFREAFRKAFTLQKQEVRKLQRSRDIVGTSNQASKMSMDIEIVSQSIRDLELLNMRQSMKTAKVEREVAVIKAKHDSQLDRMRERMTDLAEAESLATREMLTVKRDYDRERASYMAETEGAAYTKRSYKKQHIQDKMDYLVGEIARGKAGAREKKVSLESTHTNIEILKKLITDLVEENHHCTDAIRNRRTKVAEVRKLVKGVKHDNDVLEVKLREISSETNQLHDDVEIMGYKSKALRGEADLMLSKHNDLRRFASDRFFPKGQGPTIAIPTWASDDVETPTPENPDAYRAWVGHGYRYKRQTSPSRRRTSSSKNSPESARNGSEASSSPFKRHSTTHAPASSRSQFGRSGTAPPQQAADGSRTFKEPVAVPAH